MSAPTVLVLDDDDGIRRLICEELQRDGYNVLEACHGRLGLSLVEEESPDVVVLDLRMPGMDGLQFLRRLTASATGNCSVVVISGSLDAHTLDACHDAGVSATIEKPFTLATLRDAVKQAAALRV